MAQIGDRLAGKYRLIRSIGKGGMGEVFEAVHEELNKRVAIKIPSAELLDDQRNLERFKREPRVAAATGHRGIVDVYDIGTTNEGIPFVVMEYLEGESFADLIDRSGKVEVSFVVYIIAQVLSALAAAHAKGIIHRDLKPENVFLVDTGQQFPEVKILDFGTSKVVAGTGNDAPRLTQSGTILGTPYYMAPEQIRAARNLDQRLDIYAVGVTFYEAVTGQIPFESDNVYTLVHMVLHDDLIPPRVFNGDLHPYLETVILKAMNRERDERFASAEDMLVALLPFMDDLTRIRVSIPERLRSVESRHGDARAMRSPAPPPVDSGMDWAESSGLGSSPTLEVELPTVPETGLVLGRYALVRELHRNGTETSYLGVSEDGEGARSPVTVKVIHSHLLPDHGSIRGFIQNARTAAKLLHPAIVRVLDVGEHGGRYHLVVEYVHGYRFEALLDFLIASRHPLSVEHAVFVAHKVLLGLAYIHGMTDELGESLDLVHGHISPDSVIVSAEGQIKISDIASPPACTDTSTTNPSRKSRSFAYMAPEQVRGESLGHKVDLFSVGVLLYEMLAGRHLFVTDDEAEILERVGKVDVPDILGVRPDLPLPVSELLARVLVQDPAQRFESAAAFAAALRGLLPGTTPGEIEPSFRAMVAQVLADPGFTRHAGRLFDLPAAIESAAIEERPEQARRGIEPTPIPEPAAAPAPAHEPTTPPAPVAAPRGSPVRLMVALMVAVVVLAGASVAIALYALSNQDRGRTEPGRPVAMIITQQPNEAGSAADAGTTPSRDDAGLGAEAGAVDSAVLGPRDGSSETADPPTKGNSRRPAPLTGQEVTSTLMRRQAQLLQCITRHRDGGRGGQIVAITVDINRDGSVASAIVQPASMNGTPLGQCVAGVARSIRFPRHTQSDAVFRIPVRLE